MSRPYSPARFPRAEHRGTEHHRPDFAISSPEVVLAAIAARTQTITLGSAVTVLSSDDPVRVYERFATLDAISDGRGEPTAAPCSSDHRPLSPPGSPRP